MKKGKLFGVWWLLVEMERLFFVGQREVAIGWRREKWRGVCGGSYGLFVGW